MLYYTIRVAPADQRNPQWRRQDFQWHEGEKIPKDHKQMPCLLVQADGDELNLIRRTFSNIPMSNANVVTWTGDWADFILHNLG